MIEKPPHVARKTTVGRNLVEYLEIGSDGLVVGGMKAEAPAIIEKKTGGCFEIGGEVRAELWPGLREVLEVRW
jgi:hypothetical protein